MTESDDSKGGPRKGSLDFILREHEYISASLLANRKKGTDRFNLYVVVVVAALAVLGLRQRTGSDISAVNVIFSLVFLSVFGWLMLATLVRRSITTDLHLDALGNIRDYMKTTANDRFKGVLSAPEIFERKKHRYYERIADIKGDIRVDIKDMLKRFPAPPHYGDLIENICAINSFVFALLVFRTTFYLSAGISEELDAVILANTYVLLLTALAFTVTLVWAWFAQIAYVCYKHSADSMDDEENRGSARGIFKVVGTCGLAVVAANVLGAAFMWAAASCGT